MHASKSRGCLASAKCSRKERTPSFSSRACSSLEIDTEPLVPPKHSLPSVTCDIMDKNRGLVEESAASPERGVELESMSSKRTDDKDMIRMGKKPVLKVWRSFSTDTRFMSDEEW